MSSLSSTVSSEQSSSTQTSSFTVTNFTFTRPFTTNQKHSDIKTLQQLLTSIGFYTGEVNGMYDKQTKNAVYQFQLAN
ncbi:TPA: hypothetical protein DEP21_04060 [Patescibacteria group bacterium]|nr:hypothetical protein [Candidatus Gracilibacteria bacterium]